jgi:hypothetical protein
LVAEEVLCSIKNLGGRFLKQQAEIQDERHWEEVSHSVAVEKISRTFRDMNWKGKRDARLSANNSRDRELAARQSAKNSDGELAARQSANNSDRGRAARQSANNSDRVRAACQSANNSDRVRAACQSAKKSDKELAPTILQGVTPRHLAATKQQPNFLAKTFNTLPLLQYPSNNLLAQNAQNASRARRCDLLSALEERTVGLRMVPHMQASRNWAPSIPRMTMDTSTFVLERELSKEIDSFLHKKRVDDAILARRFWPG